MICEPLDSLDAWVAQLGQAELPVLRHTARAIAGMAEDAEHASERALVACIQHDPLMSLKVLAFVQKHRGRSQNADITTVGRAVMMMGMLPFFHEFRAPCCAEDLLSARPQALLGLLHVLNRARNASHFAREWAIVRHDLDVEEITVAALLHDFAEMLLWCFAPEPAMKAQAMQARDPQLRSDDAQRAAFGVGAVELQQALALAWELPGLLRLLMDDAHASNPRVRNVVLAARLARHVARGWGDPALSGDYQEIGELLHLDVEAVKERVGAP